MVAVWKLKLKKNSYLPKGKQSDYTGYKVNSKQLTCEKYFHRYNNVTTENGFDQNCDVIIMGGWF